MDQNEINYFAKTNFRNQYKTFGIKREDRRKHVYVIGKTGSGKTTLLENLIVQDIKNGEGVGVIDPHGDLVEKILDYIPSHRINDTVYFNPADLEYPVTLNILENKSYDAQHLISASLISTFKKIWIDFWGARLEYILRNIILALLDYPDTTLLSIPKMLNDEKYRTKIVNSVQNKVVRNFWLKEYSEYSKSFRAEAISPIQNKVGQFLSIPLIRNIISWPRSSFNPREVMDNKKIFLANLSKGRIGEDASRLLGALLISKFQLAAMERVDIPEQERQDFYLFIDEFQNFSSESFAEILSEARKYRLCLTLCHQYIDQLEHDIRSAIFGNVGTIINFRLGVNDAKVLAEEYANRLTVDDIINLSKFSIYLKLSIDGITSKPFSADTLPPQGESKGGNKEKIIKVSRQRYAQKREIIERQVERWTSV